VSQGRYVAFQMAEVAIAGNLFGDILRRIAELRPPICDAFMKASKRQEFGEILKRLTLQWTMLWPRPTRVRSTPSKRFDRILASSRS
jgi:hypothetical protein